MSPTCGVPVGDGQKRSRMSDPGAGVTGAASAAMLGAGREATSPCGRANRRPANVRRHAVRTGS